MGLFYRLNLKKNLKEYSKNESVPVIVIYNFNYKKIKISTGISVKIKDWDNDWRKKLSKDPIKNSDEDSKTKNILIKGKLSEVRNIVERLVKEDKIPTTEIVKSFVREKKVQRVRKTLKEVHFLILFEKYETWVNSDNFPNRESYVRTLNPPIQDIKKYTIDFQLKNKILLLPSDINDDWVNGLIKWCYKKGLQPSTIRKRTKVLVNFSTWCRENEFGDFSIKKPKSFVPSEEREVICLTRKEVIQLFNFTQFNFDDSNHVECLKKHKCLSYIDDKWINDRGEKLSRTYTSYEVYRDMLLFLCNVGCRFGDMIKMRVGDFVFDDVKPRGERGGYFRFFMEKSRVRREVKVSINQMTDIIFRKYVKGKNSNHFIFPQTKFGNPISNQKFNLHTKHLSQIIGLKRPVRRPEFDLYGKIIDGSDKPFPLHNVVVSHIGRRTFIREHIERGTPIRTIMKMTGHTTQKVFDGYYSVLDKDIMSVNDDLYSQTLREDYTSPKPSNKQSKSTSKEELEEQLKRLLELNEKGILPDNLYTKKVSQLIGLK